MDEFDNLIPPTGLDRRAVLAGAGGLLFGTAAMPIVAAGAAGPAAQTSAPVERDAWMDNPQRRYENFLRIVGDLSGEVSPQWWRGVYIGVVPGSQPKILFRLQGCEMKRVLRRSETECEVQYRIFTSFNDPQNGEPLGGKTWLNPFTQQEVVVEPNISSADTLVKLTDRGIIEMPRAGGFEAVVHLDWAAQDSTVLMAGYKDRPARTPIPTGEYATQWVDRTAAADFAASRLEMKFNSTFAAGFRKFLGMPAGEGLAIWHASGIKARSVEGLPEAYLRELWRYRPEIREWLRARS